MSRRKNFLQGASLSYRSEIGLNTSNAVGLHVSSLTGTDQYFQYDLAEVIDVIYSKDHSEFKSNEDIGKIRIRFIINIDKDESLLLWAWPMVSSFIQYPLKGELVNVVEYLGRYFYFGSLNFFNSVNNNFIIGLSGSPSKATNDNEEQYNKISTSNIPQKSSSENKNENKTFSDNNKKIKPPLPNEGDTIIRGRFGNTIRFGNNPETNSANIKISVGQSDDVNETENLEPFIENINDDKNSIWITSDEVIDFTSTTKDKSYYLKSAKQAPNKFEGNQIIINSDRIIWNSKKEEVFIFANKGIALNTNGYVAIDSAKDIELTTLDKFNLKAQTGTYVDSREIILGKNAKEPLVLGNELFDLLSDLLTELIKETHPTGAGPSGPPTNAAKYTMIKAKLRKMLSPKNRTL